MFDAIGRLLLPILIWLYEVFGNLGVAIIIFTVLIRLAIFPLTLKQLRSQKKTMALQPKIREIQRKYANDRERLTQETMKLYKEQGASPFSGCLPLLISMPILFGVWRAILLFETAVPSDLFPFLWIASLTPNIELGLSGKDPYFILPIVSILLQYVVQLMAMTRSTDPQQASMQRVMMFLPLAFGWFAFVIPAGAVLYMITGSLVAIVQQFFTTGFGSLPKYLPFLPERTGFLTPQPAVALPEGTTIIVEDEQPRRDFWTVLEKLAEPLPQSASDATDTALPDVRQQMKKAKRS